MRWWRVLTLGALAASLALNVVFFQRGASYYRDLSETRLDPLGLRYYPPEAMQRDARTSAPRIVFFGDSRAQQWPAPAAGRWTFVNRGIGGQTAVQVAQRFAAQVAPLAPQIVLVQVGVNDLKTLPVFPERKGEIIAQAQASIRRIVAQARAAGATVIVTTIFPTGAIPLYRQPFWSPDVDAAIRTVNDDIRTLAAPNVIVYDTYALLQRDGHVPPQYAADELHLSAPGYALLNQHLLELLHTRVSP